MPSPEHSDASSRHQGVSLTPHDSPSPTARRSGGVLLHPTSLPGPHGSGDLGPAAFHFVDWLVSAGQKRWQMLPLGGLGPGHSPYMSDSAFAGNPLLIDLGDLHTHGWLTEDEIRPFEAFEHHRVAYDKVIPWRMQRLEWAATRFAEQANADQRQDLGRFHQEQGHWLDDYSLYKALSVAQNNDDWSEWPSELARRDANAMSSIRSQLASRTAFWIFVQWCFFKQWHRLRAYAHQRGVLIIGDAPIFIAHQSADVWAHPSLFELGKDFKPTVVAGVPPDYFSVTGQRWGNPLYAWNEHAKQHFQWWIDRVRHGFSGLC
jgi:4-alpha-glucanotransferase